MDNYTLIDWLKSLGSKTPTPGGGAVAGLNGAIAAAQLKMVCEYTEDELEGKPDLIETIKKFLNLSEQDSQAYLAIKEAYGSKNNEKIQRALYSAIKPSEEIAAHCKIIYNFCEINSDKFNKNLLSDLVVALANIAASIESAQAMMKVNASSMNEGRNRDETLEKVERCDRLIGKVNSLKNKIKGQL
ncbi:cyclodeaminase/cyclohydrolase family protein [Candidatus Parcubacteria bacterium]|nr:cyclodeaminase/cyclohydrolase family protein [Candidatus Parcubacteria bacterium]